VGAQLPLFPWTTVLRRECAGSSAAGEFAVTEAVLVSAVPRRMASRVAWRDVAAFSALAYGLSWAWWAPIVWPYLGQITLNSPD
jgi:hypothetical protein